MAKPQPSATRLWLLATCLAAITGNYGVSRADAGGWRALTGRIAPDLTFVETANGLPANTRLSSFRGRNVVLLVFWLRDCLQCKRDLPKVQQLHEDRAASGLQVISVVHKFTLPEIAAVMRERGWTFPVVRDPVGRLAAVYGNGRRPGFYIVGVDGRVKASTTMSDTVLDTELGRWRLNELGPFPVELEVARTLVYQDAYGPALRSAERVAAAAGTRAEVIAAVGRLAALARRKLEERVDRAEAWYRRGEVKRATAMYAAILEEFAGTSLEARARVLHGKFSARLAGRSE